MGSGSHLKRLAMPRSWPIARKISTWVTRCKPGSHTLELSMPLNLIVRDVLKYASSTREVRHILHKNLVKIDGRLAKNHRRCVGLMDVLSLDEQNYRCVLDKNGKLRYRPISPSDSEWKVCRIEGKTTIKGGLTQLNLHDGRNIVVSDPNEFKTGDSVKIDITKEKHNVIMEHIPFEDGASAYLIGGIHVGSISHIKEYIENRSSMPNEVIFDGFGTITRNVFVISDGTPLPGIEVST